MSVRRLRPKPGYYEDGGLPFGAPAVSMPATARAEDQELAQLLRETRDAIRELPSGQYTSWDQDDTAEIEKRLNERERDHTDEQVQ